MILPSKNEPRLEEVPDEVKRELEFVFVDTLDEVLESALLPAGPERRFRNGGEARQPPVSP